jgi:hypothetical protein
MIFRIIFWSLVPALTFASAAPRCDFEKGPDALIGVRETEIELLASFEKGGGTGLNKEILLEYLERTLIGFGFKVLHSPFLAGRLRPFFRVEIVGRFPHGTYMISYNMQFRVPNEKSLSGYVIAWSKEDLIYTLPGGGGALLKVALPGILQDLRACWQIANLMEYRPIYEQLVRERQKTNRVTTALPNKGNGKLIYKTDFHREAETKDDWFLFPAHLPNVSPLLSPSGINLGVRADKTKAFPTIQLRGLVLRNIRVELEYEILDPSQSAVLTLWTRRKDYDAVGCEMKFFNNDQSRISTFVKNKIGWSYPGKVKEVSNPATAVIPLRTIVWEDQLQCYQNETLMTQAHFAKPVGAGSIAVSGENVLVRRFEIYSLEDFGGPH